MSRRPSTQKPSDVHDERSALIEKLQLEHLGARLQQDKEKAELVDAVDNQPNTQRFS